MLINSKTTVDSYIIFDLEFEPDHLGEENKTKTEKVGIGDEVIFKYTDENFNLKHNRGIVKDINFLPNKKTEKQSTVIMIDCSSVYGENMITLTADHISDIKVIPTKYHNLVDINTLYVNPEVADLETYEFVEGFDRAFVVGKTAFATISEAVAAWEFIGPTIFIDKGEYSENIMIKDANVKLIGSVLGDVIIYGNIIFRNGEGCRIENIKLYPSIELTEGTKGLLNITYNKVNIFEITNCDIIATPIGDEEDYRHCVYSDVLIRNLIIKDSNIINKTNKNALELFVADELFNEEGNIYK